MKLPRSVSVKIHFRKIVMLAKFYENYIDTYVQIVGVSTGELA